MGFSMRYLCFGGSFNPIHHGHLLVARAVAEASGFDRVRLIPSAQPPHKPNAADLASVADRVAMCHLAAGLSDLFEVDDLETQRSGPSYTIDTARHLTANGLGPVHWLIGADTLPLLKTWHEPHSLLEEIEFVIVARPGWTIDWATLGSSYQKLRAAVVETPQFDISATDIRRRVQQRRSIEYLTPQPVVQHIRDRGLYR